MRNSETTKTREIIKIMNALETLGYQVDSIEMQPEGRFYPGYEGQCLVKITASPLIEVQVSESLEQKLTTS